MAALTILELSDGTRIELEAVCPRCHGNGLPRDGLDARSGGCGRCGGTGRVPNANGDALRRFLRHPLVYGGAA
jgi:hypothetical protein